jgi:hypothetical protein
VIHCLHRVRRLLTQSRTSIRAFLLCALLLGSLFGLVIYPAFAQGAKALSVNRVQANPQPNNSQRVQPGIQPGGPSNGSPCGTPNTPPCGAPHVPPQVPPHAPPQVPPHVPPQAPSRGAPGAAYPGMPPTGSCPFVATDDC